MTRGRRRGTPEQRCEARDRIIADAWSSAYPPSAFTLQLARVASWFRTNSVSIGIVVSTQGTSRTTVGRRISLLSIESPTRVVMIGWMSLDRGDLRRVISRGPSVRVRVMGWLRIADDVEPRLANRAVASLRVVGVSRIPPRIRTSLRTAS